MTAPQISEKTRPNLAKILVPDYCLGDLGGDVVVPLGYVFLRAVSKAILGMAFYKGQPEQNLRNALRVVERVRGDLDAAEEWFREALNDRN